MNAPVPYVERGVYDYLDALLRKRQVAAGVFGLVLAAAAAYAFLSTPVYRASALLDIEKPGSVLQHEYQGQDDEYLPTQAKLISSRRALRRVYEDLKLQRVPEFAGGVRALAGAVTVLPVPRTRLAYVNVEGSDPRLAARIANAVAEDFVKENRDNELFVQKRVLKGLPRPDTARGRSFYEALPSVADNPLVQNIKEQIAESEESLARLKATYTDNHPAVIAAKRQLDAMRAELATQVDTLALGFRSQLSGLFRDDDVRVVDAAETPRSPERPQKDLALLIGAAGGLILGCLAALGLDTIDETVRAHGDVERDLGYQVLGFIPMSRLRRGEKVYAPLVCADASSSGEAFRNLRTMVGFAKAGDIDHLMLVTSAVQQEGKSFVAANLAVAISQLGRRVLLIDGDLRRPSQHALMGVDPRKALSDVLAAGAADPGEAVIKTEVPNLELLAQDGRPHNPSELLSAESLSVLVSWARTHYECVVVDCPPVFPVSDVLLWGRFVRSAVLVSRAGRTRLPLVRMALAHLRRGGIDVMGGVVNGASHAAMGYADAGDFEGYRRLSRELSRGGPS